jgi:hypothetical protein
MQPVALTRSSSSSSLCNLCDDAMCTICVTPLPVLRLDWETLIKLTYRRSKMLDLDACPTLSSSSRWFCGTNRETSSHLVLRPKPKNYRGDILGQITKPQPPVLRPKPRNPPTLVLMLNQETCASHLLVHGTDHTRYHPTFQSSSHQVLDLCLTIPGPLHQVFYSCLDPHRYTPCRTCYLHAMRQANVILHTNI